MVAAYPSREQEARRAYRREHYRRGPQHGGELEEAALAEHRRVLARRRLLRVARRAMHDGVYRAGS